jgi:hypothetical protein
MCEYRMHLFDKTIVNDVCKKVTLLLFDGAVVVDMSVFKNTYLESLIISSDTNCCSRNRTFLELPGFYIHTVSKLEELLNTGDTVVDGENEWSEVKKMMTALGCGKVHSCKKIVSHPYTCSVCKRLY